ncbi:dTDP-4-dehydrorhamnose reductase [Phenylobacterium sp. VNQ135]|uniref:dTDP-4-dehydrorhamnose reductase n=1 Tax=Phenylobacterium sp. VNQ135 TaxID=3400922 RepID=UPI003C0AD3FB
MSVRALMFGTTGQLAREVLRQAEAHGVKVTALSRAEADLADAEACARRVAEHRPDLVILAAAYTAVDLAETEGVLARRVNAEAPGAIAHACASAGAALVHFSTDYVFDGTKGAPYRVEDAPNPLNAYGETKLEGERKVLDACPRAVVIRTSWVVSAHGKNFVKTMLRLAHEGQPLKVVDDQFGRPTSAADLAAFTLSQARRWTEAPCGDPAFGLHHFANAGETTWRGFAQGVFDLALGSGAPEVGAQKTAERPSPATRPLRGTLDTTRTEAVFGVQIRPWRAALAEIVADLQSQTEATPA